MIHFLLSAQEVIVVSAPEPTAIVDAYAVIKIILAEDHNKQIQVLINSVERAEDAQEVFCQINSVVKRFLNREVDYLGHIERDSHVATGRTKPDAGDASFPECRGKPQFSQFGAPHRAAGKLDTSCRRSCLGKASQ